MDAIALGESIAALGFVLMDTSNQVIGHTGVQRAIGFAGQQVDKIGHEQIPGDGLRVESAMTEKNYE